MSIGKQRQSTDEGTKRAATDSGMSLAVLASAVSVALSQYQFFMRGNKMEGIFIGLWPPTILAFASYFNQKRMEQTLRSLGPNRIMESLEQVLGSR